jgi:hypothetical protein
MDLRAIMILSTGDGRGDMVMIYLPYDPGDFVGMLVSEPASGRLYRCVEVREETTVCAEVSAEEAEW